MPENFDITIVTKSDKSLSFDEVKINLLLTGLEKMSPE
jgi:hypothetical protein